jgi:hypothetical protein
MRSLSGRPRSGSATCCPVYWLRWLFSLCFCIFSYMCFILHVFSIHVSWLTLIEHTLSPVLLPCRHGIFCPVFLSHFIATGLALLLYISLHPLLWSFLLLLLRYPLTICFVRYLHCGVQLAMTPLPSLPSSHRFTSTSQIDELPPGAS